MGASDTLVNWGCLRCVEALHERKRHVGEVNTGNPGLGGRTGWLLRFSGTCAPWFFRG